MIKMKSTRRSCRNRPDIFCYICGEFTLVPYRNPVTTFLKQTYHAYFGMKLGDQDQSRSTPTSGPPKVSARAPAHRSYHFRGVKLKSCIKKIHHNLYISKRANVRIKHADTEGASHKKFGTDARVQ